MSEGGGLQGRPGGANGGGREDRRTEHIGDRDLTAWSSRAGRALATAVVSLVGQSRRWLRGASVPYVVLLVTSLVGLVVAGLLTAASAEIYDNVADHDGLAGFDRPVLDAMIGLRSPDANRLVTDFTDLGGPRLMPVIAVAAALLLAVWWRRWTPILLIAVAAGGSLLMTVIGKHVLDRARPARALAVPPFETSPSFPSGHTLNAWVILLMVAYLVCCRVDSRRWRTVTVAAALILAVAMGLSRVYLGHHWLTDVLVAWTLGSAWLVVVVTGHRLALTVRRHSARRDERGGGLTAG